MMMANIKMRRIQLPITTIAIKKIAEPIPAFGTMSVKLSFQFSTERTLKVVKGVSYGRGRCANSEKLGRKKRKFFLLGKWRPRDRAES